MKLEPGIYPGVPAAEYHKPVRGVVSKSALDQIDRSPMHYLAWLDGGREETPALRFGRMFHAALLEPDLFASSVTVEPNFGDCRFKENKARRKAWNEQWAGYDLISDTEMIDIRGMVAAVHAHPLASRMMRDGDAELSVVWRDVDTGLICKCRADYYVRRLRMVVDFKSAHDASEERFSRDVGNFRYHVQDAIYRAGFAAAGEPVEHFVFVAVEKTHPYAIALYELDADAVGRGYTRARIDIDTLAECVKTDQWPGYPESIRSISLPPWI